MRGLVVESRALGFAALLASATVTAQPAAPPAPKRSAPLARPLETRLSRAEIDARLVPLIPRLMKAGDVPGLSAAVVHDGGIVWKGARAKGSCTSRESSSA